MNKYKLLLSLLIIAQCYAESSDPFKPKGSYPNLDAEINCEELLKDHKYWQEAKENLTQEEKDTLFEHLFGYYNKETERWINRPGPRFKKAICLICIGANPAGLGIGIRGGWVSKKNGGSKISTSEVENVLVRYATFVKFLLIKGVDAQTIAETIFFREDCKLEVFELLARNLPRDYTQKIFKRFISIQHHAFVSGNWKKSYIFEQRIQALQSLFGFEQDDKLAESKIKKPSETNLKEWSRRRHLSSGGNPDWGASG